MSAYKGDIMKITLLVIVMLVAQSALASNHKKGKKVGHDKEHQHVEQGAHHDHDEKHHGEHDHKAHHPEHDEEAKAAKVAPKK